MSARAEILGSIRQSLGRGPVAGAQAADLAARGAARPRGPIPARTQGDPAAVRALFCAMAEAAAASVTPVPDQASVPMAIAAYLAHQNLPARIKAAPALTDLPWASAPLLTLAFGAAADQDLVACTPAFAGIAETGTLMLHSGPETPSTLNFLPDTHIVILDAAQITATYEDAWDRLRATHADAIMPRTVNFITGPSRTGDIEQQIQMGAHGPRRLHIILVQNV